MEDATEWQVLRLVTVPAAAPLFGGGPVLGARARRIGATIMCAGQFMGRTYSTPQPCARVAGPGAAERCGDDGYCFCPVYKLEVDLDDLHAAVDRDDRARQLVARREQRRFIVKGSDCDRVALDHAAGLANSAASRIHDRIRLDATASARTASWRASRDSRSRRCRVGDGRIERLPLRHG